MADGIARALEWISGQAPAYKWAATWVGCDAAFSWRGELGRHAIRVRSDESHVMSAAQSAFARFVEWQKDRSNG